MTEKTVSNTWLSLSALAFAILGFLYSPLFFACSIFLLASAAARRSKKLGVICAAIGLGFLLLVIGYGIGKDMSIRDNHSSATQPGHAP